MGKLISLVAIVGATVVLWRAVALMNREAVAMGIGVLFGILAAPRGHPPMAIVVLAGQRRVVEQADSRPVTSQIQSDWEDGETLRPLRFYAKEIEGKAERR